MIREDESNDGPPAGFEKMANSILGAIDNFMSGNGPWNGYIKEFDLTDPIDGTKYTHQNGSLQGRMGREVGILIESVDVPDDAPLDPKGWIIEYTDTDTDDERHVRGTVVGFDSISDDQNRTYHTLYFVPDLGSDPDRGRSDKSL